MHWKKGLQYQNMKRSVQQDRAIYRKIYEIWEASWVPPFLCMSIISIVLESVTQSLK